MKCVNVKGCFAPCPASDDISLDCSDIPVLATWYYIEWAVFSGRVQAASHVPRSLPGLRGLFMYGYNIPGRLIYAQVCSKVHGL
ncbi:hypothetical protein J6590_028042 [Homalodisca vitripennis]|nr:hypothetical protein J6590_028042 [Homalodisca vitripennis]